MRISDWSSDVCSSDLEASVAAMVAFAVDTYGRLDGAHNNAGIEMVNKPIHELTAAEWQRCLDVDLTGVFYCMKHEFLAMKDSGGGSIVNTSSGAGIRGQVHAADYVAAKPGVKRSEERRVGEGWGRTCRCRWAADK